MKSQLVQIAAILLVCSIPFGVGWLIYRDTLNRLPLHAEFVGSIAIYHRPDMEQVCVRRKSGKRIEMFFKDEKDAREFKEALLSGVFAD